MTNENNDEATGSNDQLPGPSTGVAIEGVGSTVASALAAPASGNPRWTSVDFAGTRKAFWNVIFAEMLLIAATFGIYWFWARTRVRRFIWSNTRINGSPLEYSGRGIELFIGFVVAGVIVGLIYWMLQLAMLALIGPGTAAIAATLGLVLFFWFLSAIAIYRTRRYIIRRTSWRGIRCNLDGSTLGFLRVAALPALLTTITLGLAYPWLAAKTQRYLVDNMSLGNVSFHYAGTGREIFKGWIIVWLLMLPTFGYAMLWWRGWITRYHYSAVRFGEMKLRAEISPWNIVGIMIIGMILGGLVLYAISIPLFLIVGFGASGIEALVTDSIGGMIMGGVGIALIFSIFFALSWGTGLYFVEYKITEYVLQNLIIDGSMDWSKIEQVHARSTGAGDGLDAVLSMDGI